MYILKTFGNDRASVLKVGHLALALANFSPESQPLPFMLQLACLNSRHCSLPNENAEHSAEDRHRDAHSPTSIAM